MCLVGGTFSRAPVLFGSGFAEKNTGLVSLSTPPNLFLFLSGAPNLISARDGAGSVVPPKK